MWQQAATRTAIKAAAAAREQGPYESKEEFDFGTTRIVAAEILRRENAGLAVNDVAGFDSSATRSVIEELRVEFDRECDIYEAEMDATMQADDAATDRSGASAPLNTYGCPLALPSKLERLAFWPQRRTRLPVLYFPAAVAVCTPFTPMKCERVNSAAGIIMSRLRSCMRPETLSSLVLAREWLKAAKIEAVAPSSEDTDDLSAWGETHMPFGGFEGPDFALEVDAVDA